MPIIRAIDISNTNTLQEAGALVRRSFATVAAEFQLSAQNCPRHPTFQSDDTLLLRLSQPGVACFGAFQDERMVGFAALLPDHSGDGGMELTRLCVDPAWRRREIGARLLEHPQAHTKAHGARKMTLGIISESQRLKAWYQANGFVPLRTRRVRGLPFTVCDMAKTL